MDALQWMGAVRMRVQTADKNITIIHTTPVQQLTSCEVKSCVFVRNKYTIKMFFLCDMWPSMVPILGICALDLTHPKCTHTHREHTHTHRHTVNTHIHCEHTLWTHTRSSGQPFMLRRLWSICGFGALFKGTSVVVLKVEERAVHSFPPPTIPPTETRTRNLWITSPTL